MQKGSKKKHHFGKREALRLRSGGRPTDGGKTDMTPVGFSDLLKFYFVFQIHVVSLIRELKGAALGSATATAMLASI